MTHDPPHDPPLRFSPAWEDPYVWEDPYGGWWRGVIAIVLVAFVVVAGALIATAGPPAARPTCPPGYYLQYDAARLPFCVVGIPATRP